MPVEEGVVREVTDQTNVWTFGSFNRADAAVVRGQYVSNFQAGTLTRQTTETQCRETTLVRQTRERVGVVEVLAQLARGEELLDRRRNGADVDQRLGRDGLSVESGHTVTNNALHTVQSTAVGNEHELTDATNTTVAQLVNVVGAVARGVVLVLGALGQVGNAQVQQVSNRGEHFFRAQPTLLTGGGVKDFTEEFAVASNFVRTSELALNTNLTEVGDFETGLGAAALAGASNLTREQWLRGVQEHHAEERLNSRLHRGTELVRRVGVTGNRSRRQAPRFDVKDVQPTVRWLQALPGLVDLDERHFLAGLTELGFVATVEDFQVHRQCVEHADVLLFNQLVRELGEFVAPVLGAVTTVDESVNVLVVLFVELEAVLFELTFEDSYFTLGATYEVVHQLLEVGEVHAGVERTQHGEGVDLLTLTNTYGNASGVTNFESELGTLTTHRNNGGDERNVALGVTVRLGVDTVGTEQLRNNDTLGTVVNEGAALGHNRHVTHEDEGLLDFTGLFVAEFRFDEDWALVGQSTLDTLGFGVFGGPD